MLNKLWSWMIVISVIFACFCGRLKEVNSAIFDSLEDTITMTIKLVGIMCFWSGMIKILINTSVMNKLKKLLGPFVNKVYKDEDAETKELITINIVSNMMGIGNAATPTGIKAMKKMDSNCGDEKFSSSMCLFVLMNCLSIQILPSTIMSIMERYAAPGRAYFDWEVKNAGGYRLMLDPKIWRERRQLGGYEALHMGN